MCFGATLTRLTRVKGGLFAMVYVEGGLEKRRQRMKVCVVTLLLGNGGHGMKRVTVLQLFLF